MISILVHELWCGENCVLTTDNLAAFADGVKSASRMPGCWRVRSERWPLSAWRIFTGQAAPRRHEFERDLF